MADPLNIAILGCGTVGGGVAKLLLEHPERCRPRRAASCCQAVVVRDPGKPRPTIPRGSHPTDIPAAIHDPQVHVVVELVGGTGWAKQAVLDALAAGKHVVTANKALLAEHGAEVFDAARRHGRAVAFEASVAGGIPIIAALARAWPPTRSRPSRASSTAPATSSSRHGRARRRATPAPWPRPSGWLRRGRPDARRGRHRRRPQAGHPGPDRLRRGRAGRQAIERRGIAEHARDRHPLRRRARLHDQAAGRGLARRPARCALHVAPVLLAATRTPLAQVRGAYNAIHVVGDAVGDTLF